MPLQKSFSEQNRAPPKRAHWQRSRSNPVPAISAASPRLVPVSEKTKNKLQKFQFLPPSAEVDDSETRRHDSEPNEADKENDVPLTRANSTPTPATRLVWQDLMGETKDEPCEEDDEAPAEQLLWHNDRDEVSQRISPMIGRRKRKRARSSSPASSPSNAMPATPAVNVKQLSQALRTPNADPTLQLWDRFALPGGNGASPSGLTNPMMAHLLVSSSPRPLKHGGGTPHQQSEGSLRRAISCGTQWPKRRKTFGSEPLSKVTISGSPNGDSKSSLVSALLKTVTGELNKSTYSKGGEGVPRLPSAQGGAHSRRDTPYESPSERALAVNKAAGSRPVVHGDAGESTGHSKSAGTSSSDYGDDDFDDDTLLELDATVYTIPDEELSTAVSVKNTAMFGEEDENTTAMDEDFGDFDDDLLDAAEDIMATAASQHPCKRENATHHSQTPSKQLTSTLMEQEDDTYSDDLGDIDFDAVELAATQSASRAAPSHPHSSTQKARVIQRYLVTNVLDSSYEDANNRELPEKLLVVQAERTNTVKMIHLRGDWYETPVSLDSFVHVIGHFEATGQCIIDNAQNMLILHPDQLISSTVVADSFSCTRRAVLQDRVKATSESSPALVYGTLLHEIFQEALMANKWDSQYLGAVIEQAIRKHVEDLYVIKVGFKEAREHLLSKMTEIRHWAQLFVSSHPRPDAVVQGRNGEKVNMCVSKLLDVEEHVWSPMYGLKGNIDATVEVVMRDGKDTKTLTVPFEVKTGKNVNSSHQAQTVLYNLLLSDRYDIEIVYGILYYTETSQTLRIPAIRHELRHMIMQRNQLACHVRERSVQLPPMKRSKNACDRCYAKTTCFIYHKLADDGDGVTSGMDDKFDEVVKHLTPTHKEFFLKWEDLLTKEEKESQKMRRELWTMISTEREKVGRCFANVIIQEGSAQEDLDKPKINRFRYTLIKETPPANFSFMDSQLIVGEPIVVSDEQGHFALALGYVTAVRKHSISVAVDRRLHDARIRQPGFDPVDNQVFASIMEVVPEGVKPEQSQGKIKEAPIQYRLDKDEFSNGMATVRNNLVQIMSEGPFGSKEIRRLVVDLVRPRFKTVSTQYTIADQDSLNVDQKRAITKVMSAMDYALVLGMPGTGKTTTIAHIIRALISQGKSVLLTSYTHTAVDNILLKLKTDNIPILRLGAAAKVHPEVQEFVTLAGQPMETFEEIHKAWHDSPVVATTCLGINHPLFAERTFDYCIVDEASQITLPICLGPIRMAQTFVLVGDHYQLPPLVQNEEARLGGLDVSLFKLLSDTHPDSVVNLEHQYRMCEAIMTLSNTLIYDGRLKCGTESLRHAQLHIPDLPALQTLHYDTTSFISASQRASTPLTSFCPGASAPSCWLSTVLSPSSPVLFLNTDTLLPPAREEAKGNRIVNPAEAALVSQLVHSLLRCGVFPCDVGVMTHYRSQLALLKHSLSRTGVEMHTADRFQGRDKEVVVLSLVRSNEARSIGELLKDWRRINVAFTRAKTKLLVVGSRSTLGGSGDGEMIARFVRLMEAREWVFDLPPHALAAHDFESTALGGSTAGTATQWTVGGGRSPVKAAGRSPLRMKGSPGRDDMGGGGGGGGGGKENRRPGQTKSPKKRVGISAGTLLKGKPVAQAVLQEMMY